MRLLVITLYAPVSELDASISRIKEAPTAELCHLICYGFFANCKVAMVDVVIDRRDAAILRISTMKECHLRRPNTNIDIIFLRCNAI